MAKKKHNEEDNGAVATLEGAEPTMAGVEPVEEKTTTKPSKQAAVEEMMASGMTVAADIVEVVNAKYSFDTPLTPNHVHQCMSEARRKQSGDKNGAGKAPKKNLTDLIGPLFEDVGKSLDKLVEDHGAENVKLEVGILLKGK